MGRNEEPTTRTHYQRLGVTPAASTEEIREAYRTLAGRLHPDRQHGATSAERDLADRRMREVNEAWHVLGDPARRRAYDEQRRAATRVPRAAGTPSGEGLQQVPDELERADDDLVDVLPPMTALTAGLFRHLPWVALLIVLGFIFVVTAYAGGGDGSGLASSPAPAEVGDCLDVAPGPSTTVVPCTGPHEYRLVARVASTTECPAGAEARRLATDGLFECLVDGEDPRGGR